jgi:hypothetical protein
MKSKFKEIEEQDYTITIYQTTVVKKERSDIHYKESYNLFTYSIKDTNDNVIEEDEDIRTSYMNVKQCEQEAIEQVNELINNNNLRM